LLLCFEIIGFWYFKVMGSTVTNLFLGGQLCYVHLAHSLGIILMSYSSYLHFIKQILINILGFQVLSLYLTQILPNSVPIFVHYDVYVLPVMGRRTQELHTEL